MPKARNIALVLLALLLPVFPVLAVQVYHLASGSETYRPLGVTRSNLTAADSSDGLAPIFLRVEWGQGPAGQIDRQAFLEQVTRAIEARTDSYAMEVVEVSESGIKFSFTVAGQHIGTFGPAEVAGGIQAAARARLLSRFSQTN